MPGTDGIGFLSAVRESHPDLPFVLFTGKGSEDIASDAISAGVTDYLRKGSGTDQHELLANRITNAVRQVRAERRLDEERQRFQALLENLSQAVVEVEWDGETPVVEQVNSEFTEVFGYDADEVVGESLDEYVVPEAEADAVSGLNRRIREEGRYSEAVTRLAADDTQRFLLQTAAYGDGTGAFAVYIDVTERIRRERELERQNERLDAFASVVSHDLRSPLSVAAGRLELARGECDSDHLDAVANAHDRMEALVDDPLELARQGEPVGETEPIALRETLDACWDGVATADATLRVETDGRIRADPGRFRQLVENLYRNAVEHGSTSNRTVSDDSVEHRSAGVTVTVGELDDGSGLYVEDDGPGIDPDDREAVFEAGYSTDSEGTGFGLSIVEEVAEAHGWTVEVTGGADWGARFEITGVEFADR